MKCSFCGNNVVAGRGKMFVRDTGQVFHFCDSKCQKNYNLGRQGKHVRWTKTHHDLKQAAAPKEPKKEPKAEKPIEKK